MRKGNSDRYFDKNNKPIFASKLHSQRFYCECFSITEGGDLVWNPRPLHHFDSEFQQYDFNREYAGKPVPCLNFNGYKYAKVFGKFYAVHRVIHIMSTGEHAKVVDHINRNKNDNRPCNLRGLASHRENLQNSIVRDWKGLPKGVKDSKKERGRYDAVFVGAENKSEWVISTHDSMIDAFVAHAEKQISEFGFELFYAGVAPTRDRELQLDWQIAVRDLYERHCKRIIAEQGLSASNTVETDADAEFNAYVAEIENRSNIYMTHGYLRECFAYRNRDDKLYWLARPLSHFNGDYVKMYEENKKFAFSLITSDHCYLNFTRFNRDDLILIMEGIDVELPNVHVVNMGRKKKSDKE